MKSQAVNHRSHFPQILSQRQNINYQSDPLALYQRLCGDKPHGFLLESAEINTKAHLKSILMTNPALMIKATGYQLEFIALSNNGLPLLKPIADYLQQAPFDGSINHSSQNNLTITLNKNDAQIDEEQKLINSSPLDGLRLLINQIAGAKKFDELFLGGVLSYDLIENFEVLPEVPKGNNVCPDYLFYLAETLIVIDHQQQNAEVVTHCFNDDPMVLNTLEQRRNDISYQANQGYKAPALTPINNQVNVDISDDEYCQQVDLLKKHIIAGDIFQVVPSRCFSLPCPNPLGAYRALRNNNPSPYMFYFAGPDFVLFGASPESAVKYEASNNQVEVYPIAGTRPRGKTADGEIDKDLDCRIELDLRLDQKELSEHLMLVDLARNDVAKIAQAGSRQVPELLKVDRYSHVMHLVSRVTGQLKENLDALHAYQACMNMGTLVGAPKVKAAQLIRKVEQQRRGSYGGAVGYLNGLGDMDTCIVIRSAFVSNGMAYIQAGAGIVHDSVAQLEANETRQKAQAVITAITQGGGL